MSVSSNGSDSLTSSHSSMPEHMSERMSSLRGYGGDMAGETATLRTKIQHRRSTLNSQISKEMRMVEGAENLLRVSTNRKTRETVALELTYHESNLERLQSQLAQLNSAVTIYQHEGNKETRVPMICLGLKETDGVDLATPLSRFITSHYHVDANSYEDQLMNISTLRMAVRNPQRSKDGIDLLASYVRQLYAVERRFFRSQKHNIVFQWYDSVQGMPTAQQSITFEKASVVFNIGVLHSQFAGKQDRGTAEGVDNAIAEFEMAAGTFEHLNEKFYNAPSPDMSPHILQMLSTLMLAQAQECLFERRSLDAEVLEGGVELAVELAQDTALVGSLYEKAYDMMDDSHFRGYVPRAWTILARGKDYHFRALSHYYAAAAHLDFADESGLPPEDVAEMRDQLHNMLTSEMRTQMRPILSLQEQIDRGVVHLQASLMLHRDAQRLLRNDPDLKKLDTLIQVFQQDQQMAVVKDEELRRDPSIDMSRPIASISDAPRIHGRAPRTAASVNIESILSVTDDKEDLFYDLGPLSLFNSANDWTVPREVELLRNRQGFGFAIRGNAPVLIFSVDKDSPAEVSGVLVDDVVVAVNGQVTLWSTHADVVDLVKQSGQTVKLRLVTFMRVRRSNVLPLKPDPGATQTDVADALQY